MTLPIWTIVSDDLTGLQAIAGEFARLGLRVGTGISRLPTASEVLDVEVYGFDAATRPLTPGQAEERVSGVVLLPGDVYYITGLPTELKPFDVGVIDLDRRHRTFGTIIRALGRATAPRGDN